MFGHVAQTTLQEIKGAPSRLAHRHALARTCSPRMPTVGGGPSRGARGGGRRKSRSHSRSSSTRAIESSPRPPSPSCNSSGRSSKSLARGTRFRRISLTPSAGAIFAFIGGILWALCLPPADILPDSSGSVEVCRGAMGIAGGLWLVAEALFRRPEDGHSVRTEEE